jgi:hypothetical protein
VVLLGRQDGRLEAWDLLDRTHQAALVAPVAPCALLALAVTPAVPSLGGSSSSSASKAASAAPQLLVVGDAAGTLRLLELPRALRRRGHAEVRAMAALLQREEERLGAVARRAEQRLAEQREAAERQRAAATAAALGAARRQQREGAAAAPAGEEDDQGQDGSAAAEARYLALEQQWRSGYWGLRRRCQQSAVEPSVGGCSLHPWPLPDAAENAPIVVPRCKFTTCVHQGQLGATLGGRRAQL